MSSLFSNVSDFFGLDIGSTAIRLVQLRKSGGTNSLVKYAYVPIESKIALSDSASDQQKLAQNISQLVKQAALNTRNVSVGIPSSKVFTTVADADRLSSGELAKAIPYQVDSLIPTPIAESKYDWAVIGDSPVDKNKVEILLSSVPSKIAEARLDMLEAIGLNVIAFEPDNLALARALTTKTNDAQLILDIGHKATDIIIVMNQTPHLTRSIPTGMEAIFKAATQNLNVDEKQAREFVLKFGLNKEKLEGQIYEAISNTIDILMAEIEKSLKFFMTRYEGNKVSRITVTGGASILPEFPLYAANKFGVEVEIGNVWQNVSFSQDRINELLSLSYQFGVAVGLAERD